MGKNIKKISLAVSVAFDTDLEKVKSILDNILFKDERILKVPAPSVFAKDFTPSSIEFELQYWVNHIREASALRSDLIYQINKAFKEEGIVIPFPQQELHINTIERSEGEI
jgi:small-conductance mechanosensitive channel